MHCLYQNLWSVALKIIPTLMLLSDNGLLSLLLAHIIFLLSNNTVGKLIFIPHVHFFMFSECSGINEN